MKKQILFLAASFLAFSITVQASIETSSLSLGKETSLHVRVKNGESATGFLSLVNTGSAPLVIENLSFVSRKSNPNKLEILENNCVAAQVGPSERCLIKYNLYGNLEIPENAFSATTYDLKVTSKETGEETIFQALQGHQYGHKRFITIPQGVNGFEELPSNTLNTIFVDKKTKNFYLATNAGLVVGRELEGEIKFHTYTTQDGLPSNLITSVFSDGKKLYIGTEDGGLAISTDLNTDEFSIKTKKENGLASNHINNIFVDEKKIYIGTPYGLSISTDLNGNIFNKKLIKSSNTSNIEKIYIYKNKIYLATWNEVYVSSDLTGDSFRRLSAITHYPTSIFLHNDKIYIGTTRGLLVSSNLSGEKFELRDEQNGLPNGSVKKVFAHEDKVYVATKNGLSISDDLSGIHFHTKTKENGLGSNIINDFFVENGKIHAISKATEGTHNPTGFFSLSTNLEGDCFKYRKNKNGLVGKITDFKIYKDKIYAGVSDQSLQENSGYGLAINKDSQIDNFQTKTMIDGLTDDYVRSVFLYKDKIYVGGMNGLSISNDLDGSEFSAKRIENSDLSNSLSKVFVHKGRIYTIDVEGALSISKGLDAQRFKTKKYDNISLRNLFFYEDRIYFFGINSAYYPDYRYSIFSCDLDGNDFKEHTSDQRFSHISNIIVYKNKIYVASEQLWVSTDLSGKYFEERRINTQEIPEYFASNSIGALSINEGKIYAGTSNGLLISSEANENQVDILTVKDGLSGNIVQDISIKNNKIYVVTNGGLSVADLD